MLYVYSMVRLKLLSCKNATVKVNKTQMPFLMFDQIGGNFQSLVTLINNTINCSYFT